jgi:hypothetical protein
MQQLSAWVVIKRVNRQQWNAEFATHLQGVFRSGLEPMHHAAVLPHNTLDGNATCKQVTSEGSECVACLTCIDGPASQSFVSSATRCCSKLVCGSQVFVPWAQPDVINKANTASDTDAIFSSLIITNSAIAALSPMVAEEGVLCYHQNVSAGRVKQMVLRASKLSAQVELAAAATCTPNSSGGRYHLHCSFVLHANAELTCVSWQQSRLASLVPYLDHALIPCSTFRRGYLQVINLSWCWKEVWILPASP